MLRIGIAVAVMVLALSQIANAAPCAETCRRLGRDMGWKRSETVGCTKACKRAQRACRGLDAADRRARTS